MRYVTRSVVGFFDDEHSATASEIIVEDQVAQFSGLLDANGERLYRMPDRVTFGFQAKPRVRVKAR
jgi:hypothetical protein